ncbi:alpha/beta fold hydrolase [Streptomyces sp. NPDC057496]|uniref:alpha/beta fold hydrolase n=1 Tax=Streptomyces sp. NPDC057496 TaxID=3346149 RepID=UPI0036BB712C
MPTTRINGIPLDHDRTGSGPPVLMIMGSGATKSAWHLHQVPALVAEGFEVVTFTNRGIPASGGEPGFTLDDMAADTIGLIEHLGITPCSVVGMSLGARVAREVARTRPDLVSKLVLVAPRGRLDRMRAAAVAAETALADSGVALPPRYRAMVRATQNLSPRTLADDEGIADWLDLFELTEADGPGARTQLDLGAVEDRPQDLAGITAPCRVIAFADDIVAPPHLAEEIAKTLPRADYHVVPDCGHYGYLERPDRVNRLITEFLRAPETTQG